MVIEDGIWLASEVGRGRLSLFALEFYKLLEGYLVNIGTL